MVRPRLVVSQCLELDPCRYNGVAIRAPLVAALAEHVELVPVCPEIAVVLGVPRDPIRLVRTDDRTRLVQPTTGLDLTDAMEGFATDFLDGVGAVDGFLLKSRSPSCGIDGVKAALALVQGWVRRFDEPWLEGQAYLAPYPRPLHDLRVSGA